MFDTQKIFSSRGVIAGVALGPGSSIWLILSTLVTQPSETGDWISATILQNLTNWRLFTFLPFTFQPVFSKKNQTTESKQFTCWWHQGCSHQMQTKIKTKIFVGLLFQFFNFFFFFLHFLKNACFYLLPSDIKNPTNCQIGNQSINYLVCEGD